jgi:pimeloyl-ACP methyl ester carboxylesterase
MIVDMPDGTKIYAYTGGKPLDPARPTLVMVHGVLNDHSVWILQSRYLAHHGWNVLAIDLPGHGRSVGLAPRTTEAGAQAIAALLLATGVQRFALCGHSFGSLIALHLAATCPERVSHLIMVGTAFPMRVSPALLQTAQSDPAKAIAMVTQFSHSTLAPPPSALGPGTWLYGSTRALMRRVLASNPHENVFHIGFKACDEYLAGYTAMAAVVCPVLFILGEFDQMTLPKNASGLIDQARKCSVVTVAAGHMIMNEAPDATLTAITAFLH